MKALVVAGAIALIFAVAACGGGSTTTGPVPLTKSQWIRQADSICRSTERATEPIELRFAKFAAEGRLKMAARPVRLIISALRENGGRLRRLGVPRGDATVVRRFTAKLKETTGRYLDFADALESGNASTAGRVQQQLRETEKLTLAAGNTVGVRPCGIP